jgi:hypothetical protein
MPPGVTESPDAQSYRRLQDLRQADATDGSPLIRRTCDACKAIQQREYNRRGNARRTAK